MVDELRQTFLERTYGIGAQDGDLVQAVYPGDSRPLLVPAGHAYAFAIRGANEMRHRAALYIYGDSPTGWISKDGAHDRELTHGAPSLGW